MAENIFYDLSTDKAFRDDKSEIANLNLPENIYKTTSVFNLQLLNSQTLTADEYSDFYTGFVGKTVTARAAVDNNFIHTSTALLSTALPVGVPAANMIIKSVGTNFNSTRPAGTINIGAESVNYNAITDNGDDTYTLQMADGSFVTQDFTPAATYAVDTALITVEIALIVDSAVDVTDKDTGLLVITNDAYNSVYQAEANGLEEIENCFQEFSVIEAGTSIMRKRFAVACLGALDDDGESAPAPTGGYYNKTESDSRYVQIAGSIMTEEISFQGIISPAQITTNKNNYNPTNLATSSTLRLDSDAAYNITGLQGGSDGRILIIHNIGSFALTLKDESVSSTAANRFALENDLVVNPDTMVFLQYDSTSSRWRGMSDSAVGDVTASASITDNALIRGDGGAKGVQDTGIIVDDSDNISGINNVTGSDTNLVTGTAGSNGNLVQWNADGDVVDSSLATSDVVTPSSTNTLTNKTFDANGTGNSLSNVDLSADVTGTLPIANGGSGQATQTAAFDALSPTTTKADVIVNDGSNNVRLAVGANTEVLTADSTQPTGVKWAPAAGGGDMTAATYDPATISEQLVGLTASQTLTNKTLTSPVINVTSDAQGDIYYRDGSGNFTRLAPGTDGQLLKTQGAGANPIWVTASGVGDMLAATYDPATISEQLVGLTASQTLTNKTLTSPTVTTQLIDDGDAGLTLTSANQTHATPVATIPDIVDAADSFVMNDTSATITNKTIAAADNTQTIFTEAHASSHTLSASECYGGVYYVTGAATLTLPAVASGMHITVLTIGAVAVSVDPNASDKIWLDGTVLDDGDKITNTSTAGDIAVLTYYSADGWYASTNSWTDGGA